MEAREHFVPRFLVKNFCDDRGNLHTLTKRPLAIGRRTRSPSQLFYGRGFYVDSVGNLDVDWIQRPERVFANVVSEVASADYCDTVVLQHANALLQMCLTLLSRTRYMPIYSRAYLNDYQQRTDLQEWHYAVHQNVTRIVSVRQFWTDYFKDRSVEFAVLRTSPTDGWIITDNPVVANFYNDQMCLRLPIAHDAMLLIGTHEYVDDCASLSVLSTNLDAFAWSDNVVACRDRATLIGMERLLIDPPVGRNPEWQRCALLPFFGAAERLAKSQSPPSPFV